MLRQRFELAVDPGIGPGASSPISNAARKNLICESIEILAIAFEMSVPQLFRSV